MNCYVPSQIMATLQWDERVVILVFALTAWAIVVQTGILICAISSWVHRKRMFG